MPERHPGGSGFGIDRRRFLGGAPLAAGWLIARRADAAGIVAVRVWPSRDYTRVTLELDGPLQTTHILVPDPPRLVVDLDGVDLDATLRDLVAKVQPDDPYIRQVRVGQFKPRVVRIVLDLKTEIAPQVFRLAPVAQYRHRVVLDLYPLKAEDPLQSLLAQGADPAAQRPDPLAQMLRDREATGSAASVPSPPGRTAPGGSGGSGGSTSGVGTAPASGTGSGTTAVAAGGPASGSNAGAPPGGGPANAGGGAPASPPSTATPGATAAGAGPLAAVTPDQSGTDGRGSAATARSRRPATTRLVTIALDPGHGGEDPGAIGREGTREKDVVLAIGRLLKERIAAEPNMRAFMTRDADFFVPLATRVDKARRVRADLFVSIHADAFVTPQARGASVYVLSESRASSGSARWLADRENKADLIGGVNLGGRDREVAKVLLELSTTAQIRDSSNLGRIVLGQLGTVGSLHRPEIEKAGFAVLKAPDIPSILVETAFISNPEEEKRLGDQRYQAKVADAIFRGLRHYLIRFPPAARGQST